MAMAGVSRHMTRSLIRCCSRTATHESAAAATGRGLGGPTRPPVSNSVPKSMFERQRPTSFFGSIPREVACIQGMLPFHSAVASAKMISHLCTSDSILLQVSAACVSCVRAVDY